MSASLELVMNSVIGDIIRRNAGQGNISQFGIMASTIFEDDKETA